MRRYYIIFILLFLFSCHNSTDKQEKPYQNLCRISTYNYYYPFKNRFKTLTVDKKITKDFIVFRYEPFPDTAKIKSSLELRIIRGQDSFIFIDGDTCIYEESKDYVIRDKKYKIKKYFFDLKNACDEEGEFLINDSLGLVFANSVVWPAYSTYIHDWTSYELNKLFDEDTSLFIRHKNNFEQYELKLQKLINI